jgi:hypothetical protein
MEKKKQVKILNGYAKKGDYKAAEKYLEQNAALLKEIFDKEGKDGVIKNFYAPYAVAYDNPDRDFCLNYQIKIDEILQMKGQDSALFTDENY